MAKKLIIEAAIHELTPKSNNPNVPYGPDEVAPDVAACVAEGLSFLHFHARDPDTGEQLWTDADSYKQSILGMRDLGVPAGLPWYPTYGGLNRQAFAHIATLAGDPEVGLPMTGIDLGTANLNDFDPTTGKFVSPDFVQSLSHAGAKDLFDLCRELGIRPYLGVYEPGHLRHIGAYLDKGWIEPPLVIKFAFSDIGPVGLPPEPECLGWYAEMIDMVLPGVPVEWFVTCNGPSIWKLAPAAIELGGHVRVGLGQYHPWSWPDLSNERPTNAEQVARVAEMARAAGREIATVDEARAMLGLAAV